MKSFWLNGGNPKALHGKKSILFWYLESLIPNSLIEHRNMLAGVCMRVTITEHIHKTGKNYSENY